jgi:hypothetical protein
LIEGDSFVRFAKSTSVSISSAPQTLQVEEPSGLKLLQTEQSRADELDEVCVYRAEPHALQ